MSTQPLQDLTPREVPAVETKYRRIATPIPVPESVPILRKLQQFEARPMSGQPPIVWDRAEGVQVFDRWGNTWIDWTSGVLVANVGHSHPKIRQAIIDQVQHGLLHNFAFPLEIRAELVQRLVKLAPDGLSKAFLLSTGSEGCEWAIKVARTHGQKIGGRTKNVVVSFQNAFHGRTLGSQMAGGIPVLKEWIVNLDEEMIQVPFPDGFRCPDTSFDVLLDVLKQARITPDRIAAVMSETYQGGDSSFAPAEYFQHLRRWCDEHKVLMILDEVQAGFGRSGTFWGFEHYGIAPDLICCGKAISGGMPISAVLGQAEVMDHFPPVSATSTHAGNPVCVATALANLEIIEEENLVEHASRMGEILLPELRRIGQRFPQHIGAVHGKGLVASLHMVVPGGIEPNHDLAGQVIRRCVEKGLLLLAPVGYAAASIKVAPPLVIGEEPLRESIAVLEEALQEVIQ